MNPEKMQQFKDDLVQQLEEIQPKLTGVLKKHGLAEVFEVEIRLNPIKKSIEEAFPSEDIRGIPQQALRICILTDVGPICID